MKGVAAVKSWISACIDALGSRRFAVRQNNGFRVFLYHSVGERTDADTLGLTVSADGFRRQARLFREERVARLEYLVDAFIDSKDTCCGHLALAFDDGYKDNLTRAAEILNEFDLPATFFVRAGLLSGQPTGNRYWDKWEYLSVQDIKRLAGNSLFDFGSHGVSHQKLTSLSDAQLFAEIRDSKDMLENAIGRHVSLFSYPYGCLNERVKCAVSRAGYKAAFSSYFGVNTRGTDRFELRRIEISGFDGIRDIERKIRGSYDWIGGVQRLRGYT